MTTTTDIQGRVVARPPVLRLQLDELTVDSFAGGGGASTGIEAAVHRSPDIAINHDPEALALHQRNHPTTRHLREDVWQVDPVSVCEGRPVGLMWLSPDCKHFSKAKGGRPVSKRVRGLAWVACRWAAAVKPRVIFLENVEEFQTWGPVLADGRPCPARKGRTFRAFVRRLERLGYVVEWRELRACDFGAPTIRKRLFLIARCDGAPIVWPEPTHGPGRAHPHRTAAECIDWSLPCPSIFDRARPLAENTLRRIAAGLRKFVLEAPQPFIVSMTHHGGDRVESLDEPMRTVTAHPKGGGFALVSPVLIEPGQRHGRGHNSARAPMSTVVAKDRHALVAAFLAKHQSERDASQVQAAPLDRPAPTVKTRDSNALVTVTLGPDRREEVRAFLVAYYGNEQDGQALNEPMRTLSTRDRFGLVTVHGQDYEIIDIGMRMLSPRELYRAQGFPDTYAIDAGADGTPLTKTAQVRMCGNSVCPPMAEALVRANVGIGAVAEQLELVA